MKKASKAKKYKQKVTDEELKEYLSEHYGPDMLVADGLSDAFVCVAKTHDDYVCCYDGNKVLDILRKRDGMDYDEAWEYYCYNILGANMGKGTPIFLNPDERKNLGDTKIY